MVYKCSAPACKSGYKGHDSSNITMHKFPTSPSVLAEWLSRIPRLDFTPTSSSRLCSLHFKDSDFVIESMDSNRHRRRTVLRRRRLRHDAIPSIFRNVLLYPSREVDFSRLEVPCGEYFRQQAVERQIKPTIFVHVPGEVAHMDELNAVKRPRADRLGEAPLLEAKQEPCSSDTLQLPCAAPKEEPGLAPYPFELPAAPFPEAASVPDTEEEPSFAEERPPAENEFEAFGRSIAAQLQQFPLDVALELQLQVQTLITQRRLHLLRDPCDPQ